MSASSLSLPIFLRINFLISYLIVTDSQNTFDWHTQRALLNDKKAGAGCTSRAFKHPGRDVTAPDVWPSILTDYTYDSELDNADGVPLASRRSSMFPEGNFKFSALLWEMECSVVCCSLTNGCYMFTKKYIMWRVCYYNHKNRVYESSARNGQNMCTWLWFKSPLDHISRDFL